MRDLIRPDASFTPRELFARMQGAWFEPRQGYMWQENTGATATTTGGQTVGKLVDLTAARVASQATAANRPIYGVRRNLLTYSEDFSQSVWVKNKCTLIASNAPAPDGSNTAATFRFLPNIDSEVYQPAGEDQLAGAFRLGFYTVWIRRRAGSGQVRLKTPSGTGYTDVAVTAEWQKFTSATTDPFTYHIAFFPGINLNEVNGELDIWHPYMTYADAPDDFGGYQRITTAADYDPGPYPALAHDGTDSLSVALPAINVRRNLLTYSEQFDNVIWTMLGGPVTRTTNAVYATPYTKQATLISSPSSALFACLAYIIPTSATRYTFTIRAKQYNNRVVWLYYLTGADYGFYYFDLGDGSTQIVAGSTQTYTVSMSADGDGWYKCSLTITGFSGPGYWGFGVADAKGSTSVTAGSGIYVADAQLELGSVATPYQKITDWTSEQYSSAGSVYFSTPQGMSCLHNQSIGTSYNLPALQTDIYGVVITPARLAPPLEKRLELYMLRLAGLIEPDYLLDDNNQQLTDDSGELLLRA